MVNWVACLTHNRKAYQTFTIFSHALSVSLFSINKSKQKNHCSNFIPTICDLFWVGVGVGVCLGEGGGCAGAAVIGGGRLFE